MPETTQASVIVVPPPSAASAEPAPISPVTEAPPEEPKLPSRDAQKFAALRKADKEIVEKKQQFAAERQKFQEEQQAVAPILEAIKVAKTNPIALLNAAGVSLDEVIRAHLATEEPVEEDKVTALERRIEERERREAEEKEAQARREQEAQDKHIQTMIESYHKETTDFIKSKPEDYELIIANDAFDDVFGVITEYFKQHGKIISPEEAARAYEDHLLEDAKRLLSLKKLAPKVEERIQEAVRPEPEERYRPVPRSLSNTQVLGNPVAKPPQPTTREARREAAIAKLQFVK